MPPPIPAEAVAVLEAWSGPVREVLGAAERGARLYGSIPLGGFEPFWSDIDVCVLLAEPVSNALAAAVGRVHREVSARFDGSNWRSSQFLEACYVPESIAARPGAEADCLFVGSGEPVVRTADPVPGFDRYMLAHHSVVLFGEPSPFEPDHPEAVVRQQDWLPELLARPASEHSPIMIAGLLQEAARTLVFFRDGTFLSKSAALLREVEAESPYRDTFLLALRVRRDGSARAYRHRTALREAYDRSAAALCATLRALRSA